MSIKSRDIKFEVKAADKRGLILTRVVKDYGLFSFFKRSKEEVVVIEIMDNIPLTPTTAYFRALPKAELSSYFLDVKFNKVVTLGNKDSPTLLWGDYKEEVKGVTTLYYKLRSVKELLYISYLESLTQKGDTKTFGFDFKDITFMRGVGDNYKQTKEKVNLHQKRGWIENPIAGEGVVGDDCWGLIKGKS